MPPSIWDQCAIIEVVRPCCPQCRCESYIPIKGREDSDGVRTSRRICERCSVPYVVISELYRCQSLAIQKSDVE